VLHDVEHGDHPRLQRQQQQQQQPRLVEEEDWLLGEEEDAPEGFGRMIRGQP
jgi:hypothetical protein